MITRQTMERLACLTGLFLLVAPRLQADGVEGRYIYYGNPLSAALEIAEIEVFSGGTNVIAGRPECISPDYLFTIYRGPLSQLVDGNKDTESRHLELVAEGSAGYSDRAPFYDAVEIDLGRRLPIEQIDIYRARYTYRRNAELGWRYLLVLDEARRIVAWEAFNVFSAPHPANKGLWSFVPQPAAGVPAGRVVPVRNRSWLSEAEFLRDFLGKPVVDLTGDLSEADRERLAQFERRNEPEELARLGETFFRLVELDRPGMAPIKALVEQHRYAEALEAFKIPFFKTISMMVDMDSFEYTWGYDPDSRDTMRVRDLLNHVHADKKTLSVTAFKPGLMPPATFTYPFQMRPLLAAYSANGETKLLRLWEQMTDDWALGFQEAADGNPDLREHFVLIAAAVTKNLQDLAQTAAEHPDFVSEVSGATLARFMMPILEEMPVAIWRVWRKCVFNHTFNATGGAWQLSKLLADFKAGTRLERELRQQMLRLHTLSQYRDGSMAEIVDEGHFVFNYKGPAQLYGQMCVDQPDWFTPAREAYLLDALRQAELVPVRHTASSGIGNRWQFHPGGRYPTFDEDRYAPERAKLQRGEPVETDVVCAFLQAASVMQESEPRAIANTVYGWGRVMREFDVRERRSLGVELFADRYQRLPRVLSDWQPYSGCWYFRGGWTREDAHLHMLSPPISNSTLGFGHNKTISAYEEMLHTSYRLQDYATLLISVFATEIDGQPPCGHYGRFPSGSKQSAFTQATEKPQPRRWYTDARLDFGEAVFEGAYHTIYRRRERIGDTHRHRIIYEDSPVLIHDARTSRQIFQIRPARLFLQVERVAYASPDAIHTNRIPATLLLTEPGPETGKAFTNDQFRIDHGQRTVSMRNPGNPGVTVAWCGQPDLSFKPYSVNSLISKFWPQPDPEKVNPTLDAKLYEYGWGKGFDTLNGDRRTSGRGVFAQWEARGSSVLVGAVYANRPGEEPVKTVQDISTDTVAGLRVETAKGVVVTLLAARHIPAILEVGDVTMEGEALLRVEEPNREPTVMTLGARSLTVAGQTVALTSPDAVFDLNQQSISGNPQPILRPLDPPTVGPAVNTFTDSTMVTLGTISPDAEIRYTTRMPDSRMAEFRKESARLLAGQTSLPEATERLALREEEGADWTVYTEPFEITQDTLVRARTFRKGVDEVPMLRSAGTDVSMVSYGFFHKRKLKAETRKLKAGESLHQGLNYDYLEGRWFALWTYSDILPATSTGTTDRLLDVSMRTTDEPFAVRYHGYIEIPSDGVYTFHGPDKFINNICEPGYDLRVYVDGEEWDLGQTWHGRGMWSVPLAKGLHRFKVTFADARAKDIENQRIDLWGDYPQPRTTWRGVAPVIEVSGPGLERQPLPDAWLKR